jgi:NDP-sugar pyrophosphorylase family protein
VKAVLLAAGVGKRLRPLTDERPKCMVPVAGTPVLRRNVEWLRDSGVTELAVNLHHHPDVVREHFGDGADLGVSIRYSHEPVLLGTAGALRPLAPWLGEETFVVLYADNLVDCDLSTLVRVHEERAAAATVALFRRDDVSASGVAELDDDDRIVRFVEKPRPEETTSNWVSAGLVVCSPTVLRYVPEGTSDLGRDVLPALIASGETVAGYRLTSPGSLLWIDTPADLERAERALAPKVAR